MLKQQLLAGLVASTLMFHGPLGAAVAPENIDISYKKFVLKNGLTLLVHEDHKVPIVAVNIWYHVGSKNERTGKSGFAHLFEHLMFNGSEHFNDDYFQAMERIGATDLNGTTSEDRTNYFQNVPTSAVDVALWMESDRMGHLLGAIDQKKLDEQRGVVQNEKRQGENEPYGVVDELITKATWPAGHPYSWTVIGSMDDLNAASLEDVKEWFRTYYGAANATLVVAGDIDPETALKKVEKYFGDIPSGPPVAHHESWIAKRTGSQRQIVQDRVPQSRLYRIWNIPGWGTRENISLGLVARVLSDGKSSRLYKRLVYDEQIATSVSCYLDSREIGGQFYIEATAKPGVELQKLEFAIGDELQNFFVKGPTQEEVDRVKTQYIAGFVRGIERIGGFGGKSDILAQSQVFAGDPEHYKKIITQVAQTARIDLWEAAKNWLLDGDYNLEVRPFPEYQASSDTADRSKLPPVGPPPVAAFPEMKKTKLSNGLNVVVAQRSSVPLVNFSLLIDAGYASDQHAKPGTASLAMGMLDEGTKKRTALQISDECAMLGTTLSTGANLDLGVVTLNTLKANLDKSLDLFADVVLNPSFPETDFKRLQQQQLAGIQREKVTPVQMALRVFPGLLYGPQHAYGNPFTGSGTEASVKAITRDDLVKYHSQWIRPNNATLVVVGDITMDEVKPRLEKLFAGWKSADVPKKNIGEVKQQDKPMVYIMDRPGSQSSIIFSGHIAPPTNNPKEVAIETMNEILGGAFTSRINMNLREDKHWSYGSFSLFFGARGQRPFLVYATVQTDKTMESMVEIAKELTGIIGEKPPIAEELEKAQASLTLQLPGSWETMNAVGGSINNLIRYGLPDSYYAEYPNKVRALKVSDIGDAAKTVLHPDRLIWVIVGDRAKIEESVRRLNYGELHFLDGDGKVVQ